MTNEFAFILCGVNLFVSLICIAIQSMKDKKPLKLIKIIEDPNIPEGYILFMGNLKTSMPGMNKVLVGIDWRPREEPKGGEEKLLPTLLDLIEAETKRRQNPT